MTDRRQKKGAPRHPSLGDFVNIRPQTLDDCTTFVRRLADACWMAWHVSGDPGWKELYDDYDLAWKQLSEKQQTLRQERIRKESVRALRDLKSAIERDLADPKDLWRWRSVLCHAQEERIINR